VSEPTPKAPIELEPLESNTVADPGQRSSLSVSRAQPEVRLDLAPTPAQRPLRKGPARTPWQSLVSRLLLAWLPAYGAYRVCGVSADEAALNSTALTFVFAPTCEWVTQRARAMPLAYGIASITVAAATIGYAAGSALVFTLPWLNEGRAGLALAAVAAAAATTAWYALGVERFGRTRRVVVVGGGNAVGALIADAHEEEHRFEIVAIVADDPSPTVAVNPLLRGSTDELGAVIRDYAPDLVVIGVEKGRPEIFRRLLDAASADFSMLGVPEFYEVAFGRLPIRELTPAWFMSTLHVYTRPYNRFTKRVFDFAVALIGIVLTLPLIPVVAVIVKCTKGPLLYRQTRLGEHGKHFTITKFRTMHADAESADGAVWAANDDPRIIPGGRFLRRTRIDELPQFWNVLKGEMSIVGPRPERPEFIGALETEVPFWQQRGLLRPGVTGWAQIRAGYAADNLGAERKLSYDLWYLRHRSLTLDVAICVRTIGTLITGSGAR
jgi:exopolysaccharide biosynthesis polyprenyl glycosylphosphotransferase